MTVLGKWAIIIALFATGGSALFYFRAATRKVSLAFPRSLMHIMLFLLTLASALLLTLLLRHDFSNGYVYSYSDRALPIHFLLSSFYAGQEGSFLFWALCGGYIGLVLQRFTKSRGNESAVMTVFMVVQAFFLLMVAVKSPFQSLHEMFPEAPAGFAAADGRGLNPLLQNFWMVIHPPVLFIGFAAMAAPFSLAIAGLWKKDFTVLSRQGFPWVIFSTSILGLGIMLGAYWAYGVLGWGGYWSWDPVENSSLVPWLTGMALLHTMLAQLRTDKFVRTNFFLAVTSFFLVVYSTFLTRSGVLGDASVHAFTDPGAAIYVLLLVFLGAIALVSAVTFLLRWGGMASDSGETLFFSREIALGAGALLIVLSAAVVLFGTSLPIFSKIRVEPAFYDATNLPLAVLAAFLIGFSLYMQWDAQDGLMTLRKSVLMLGLSLAVCATLFVFGVRKWDALLLMSASFFAMFVNLEIAVKVAKGDWRFLGGKIAHIGLAIFFLGVIINGKYGEMQRVVLPAGQPVTALEHVLIFQGSQLQADGKTAYHVRVEDREGKVFTLIPVMFEAPNQGKMKNPDIQSSWNYDFYLSPLGEELGEAGFASVLVVDASTKPFINLLWAGTLAMMAGFIFSIVKRIKEA